MKAISFLAFVLSFLATSLAQTGPDTLWTRTYGGSEDDILLSMELTADGGYVMAGYTQSFGTGDWDFYLVKTDDDGDTLWTRTFGGSRNDYGHSVQQTDDGGYVVGGTTQSFGAGEYDMYLVKTDSEGDTLWTRTFGGSRYEAVSSVRQTTDGGYIVAGYTHSFGAGEEDFYLIKMDSQGDTLWTRTYGGSADDRAISVWQTIDGGYVMAGTTRSFGAGLSDLYLVKTNGSGDSLWTRTYGGSDVDEAWAIQQTADGGYIVAGSWAFGSGGGDFYLVKTDSQGDTVWTHTYGGILREQGYCLQQMTDGGYTVAGYTNTFGAGEHDFYLVRTNGEGRALWTCTYGTNAPEIAHSIHLTADGGFVVAGVTYSVAGGGDFYLVKTGPEQLDSEPVRASAPSEYVLHTNYPNPFNAATTIGFALPKSARVMIRAYDVLGRDVGVLADDVFTAGQHSMSWQCADCASGVYFITMQGEGFQLVRKAILLR